MKRVIAAVLLVGTMVFFFQNCGQAGFENTEFGDGSNLASEVDPKFSSLPFPYEVSVNQIAHMSCPLNVNPTSTNTPYFSWKIGAFDNPSDVASSYLGIRPAGLQLSSNFQQAWTKVSAAFDSSIKAGRLREALTTLPSVAGTQLQLSFRKSSTPKVDLMKMPNGGLTPVKNFMPLLATNDVTDSFLDLPIGPLNLFPSATDFSNRFLEASIIVPSAYGFDDAGLKANYDSSYLTVGFVKTASANNELSGPDSSTATAYGRGYRVHFGVTNPHVGTNIYSPSDSLSVVEEHDLQTGYTSGGSWDCSIKLKIVRPQDRLKPMYRANHFTKYNGACPTTPVSGKYCALKDENPTAPYFGIPLETFQAQGLISCPSNRFPGEGTYCTEQYYSICPPEPYGPINDPSNPILADEGIYHPNHPERPAILHALRRFLPADKWDINVSRRCIVPKNDDGACYAASGSASPIVYDEKFFPTGPFAKLGLYEGCGQDGYYQCAGYLTMCIRR